MKRRETHDIIEKFILSKLVKDNIHWSDLLKMTMTQCGDVATLGAFNNCMKYLLKKEYIKRPTRGVYCITEKGKRYLEIIK